MENSNDNVETCVPICDAFERSRRSALLAERVAMRSHRGSRGRFPSGPSACERPQGVELSRCVTILLWLCQSSGAKTIATLPECALLLAVCEVIAGHNGLTTGFVGCGLELEAGRNAARAINATRADLKKKHCLGVVRAGSRRPS